MMGASEDLSAKTVPHLSTLRLEGVFLNAGPNRTFLESFQEIYGYMNKILYIVRHCSAEGQQPEATLRPEGSIQAIALANFLADEGIERIVSSPFTRAVQSILPLAQRLHREIETDARLAERILSSSNLPDWLDRLRATFDDLDLHFEGGESNRTAMNRAISAINDILKHGATITCIVTHGNLMTLLLKHFDISLGFETWNALTVPDVFRIIITDVGTQMERIWHPKT